MYEDCYVRFSANDYDASKPENIFSHLTNNMISKRFRKTRPSADIIDKIPDNMWTLEKFKEYLNSQEFIKSNKAASFF
jgi:hypothetical protein